MEKYYCPYCATEINKIHKLNQMAEQLDCSTCNASFHKGKLHDQHVFIVKRVPNHVKLLEIKMLKDQKPVTLSTDRFCCECGNKMFDTGVGYDCHFCNISYFPDGNDNLIKANQ